MDRINESDWEIVSSPMPEDIRTKPEQIKWVLMGRYAFFKDEIHPYIDLLESKGLLDQFTVVQSARIIFLLREVFWAGQHNPKGISPDKKLSELVVRPPD